MPTRYTNTKIVNNDNEFYSSIRRGRKRIRHYQTPIIRNPTRGQRSALQTATHIWKYGDRFYKLANDYYGDVGYWWVIAWYNSIPTEANVYTGDVIQIPINIQQALRVLGV